MNVLHNNSAPKIKKFAFLILIGLLFSNFGCDDRRTTVTEPDQIIISVGAFSSGSLVADFIFTQDLNTDNVSLVIQNVSQMFVSFDYTINFSISSQGWTSDGSVSRMAVGASEDKGIVAFDSPTLTENGFRSIVLTSVVFGEP